MKTSSIEFVICPNCGSTDFIENYPVLGKRICTECGFEPEKTKLKIIDRENEIKDTCPFCGKNGEKDDTFFEEDEITIFKCKKCGKMDGYILLESNDGYSPFSENGFVPLPVKKPKKHRKSSYSASKAKKFKQMLNKNATDPIEKCKKQLNVLINEKMRQMYAAGISIETINSARRKAIEYLKQKPLTHKQLIILLAAAIYESSHEELIGVGGFRRVGEKVSERQVEEIFGITRKTMRKWRKRLPRRKSEFYL